MARFEIQDHDTGDTVTREYSVRGTDEAAEWYVDEVDEDGSVASGNTTLVSVRVAGDEVWDHYEVRGQVETTYTAVRRRETSRGE